MPASSTGISTTSNPSALEVRPGLRLGGVLDRGATDAAAPRSTPATSLRPCENPEQTTIDSGIRRRPADAIEVLGEGGPELRHAAPVEIAEPVARRLVERAADGPQPCFARELVQVRPPRPEVELVDRRRDGRLPCPGGARVRRDPCDPARPADQVSLGRELLERLDDDAARDPELAGQRARGRQGRAGSEPALPHRVAQALLELPVEWLRARPVQRHEHLGSGTGPDSCHRTGPYQRTGCVSL